MKIKADEIIKKIVTKFGNSGHISVGKRFVGMQAIVLFKKKAIDVEVEKCTT